MLTIATRTSGICIVDFLMGIIIIYLGGSDSELKITIFNRAGSIVFKRNFSQFKYNIYAFTMGLIFHPTMIK